jgi:hypothetical protein
MDKRIGVWLKSNFVIGGDDILCEIRIHAKSESAVIWGVDIRLQTGRHSSYIYLPDTLLSCSDYSIKEIGYSLSRHTNPGIFTLNYSSSCARCLASMVAVKTRS